MVLGKVQTADYYKDQLSICLLHIIQFDLHKDVTNSDRSISALYL